MQRGECVLPGHVSNVAWVLFLSSFASVRILASFCRCCSQCTTVHRTSRCSFRLLFTVFRTTGSYLRQIRQHRSAVSMYIKLVNYDKYSKVFPIETVYRQMYRLAYCYFGEGEVFAREKGLEFMLPLNSCILSAGTSCCYSPRGMERQRSRRLSIEVVLMSARNVTVWYLNNHHRIILRLLFNE